jgi:putative membrane protein
MVVGVAWSPRARRSRSSTHASPRRSWLNLDERWFNELTAKRLQRGSFCRVDHFAGERYDDPGRPGGPGGGSAPVERGEMHVYGEHMIGFGWGWIVGFALFVAVVVLLIWAILSITRAAGSSKDVPRRPEPLDILRERFARGEISKEEFEEARRTLGYKP